MLEKTGRFLFRYRALIAVPFFILLLLFSRPHTIGFFPIILLLAGIAVRIWTAGYIGKNAREREFRTSVRLINGPYRIFKHPLYLGNLLLVTAVTIIYSPPQWLFILIMFAFFMVYSLIVLSEASYLKKLASVRAVFSLKNAQHEISTMLVVIAVLLIYFIKKFFCI